ncbi:MAG: SIS domain-containing protein, partial [Rickettsiales bacterium]|nr:SIS domain-containing protein [Rickettsiales bacterium]
MDSNDIINVAKKVLQEDARALDLFRENFPSGFVEAVRYITDELKGKVVVAGMGKSGLVARRLAVTLASTGTKAVFLHYAEASHGDMGIIDDADCVIAMSNSGETKEMSNLLSYTRRFGIKLIGISSDANSTLAK